ncbi:essential MCU regulator, mitochondrial [Macrosteles quadrilineatus]|uniref:essential MCU regulator, mitochondrial n=1 Tax=Macrosteles quadrilineatus TaxID=74068 RepID=UPI0023E336B4|nr:essential MCU regulator, mitochondrial [Macrosteles quadrilineatus]
MASSRVVKLFRNNSVNFIKNHQVRSATTTPTGALLPEPQKTPFGLVGIVCAVVPGLLIGATISKNIANFLEENDLFVPSDDDDDDD